MGRHSTNRRPGDEEFLNDAEYSGWARRARAEVRRMCSVCSGALLLAAVAPRRGFRSPAAMRYAFVNRLEVSRDSGGHVIRTAEQAQGLGGSERITEGEGWQLTIIKPGRQLRGRRLIQAFGDMPAPEVYWWPEAIVMHYRIAINRSDIALAEDRGGGIARDAGMSTEQIRNLL